MSAPKVETTDEPEGEAEPEGEGTGNAEADAEPGAKSEPEPEEAHEPAVLGSVLDRARLDEASRVGRLSVDVAPAWLERGGALVVHLPKRLACVACEGGGCSRCANAGAFRLDDRDVGTPVRVEVAPREVAARQIRVPLPGTAVDVAILVLRPSEAPSAFVRYERAPALVLRDPPPQRMSPSGIIWTVMTLTALFITIALTLLMRP